MIDQPPHVQQPQHPPWAAPADPAQAMVGSPLVKDTPYRMGIVTQTCCVITTLQEVPAGSVVQVTLGVP